MSHAFDPIATMVILVGIAMSFALMLLIVSLFVANSPFNASPYYEVFTYFTYLDYLTGAAFVFICCAAVVLAYMFPSNPIFFFSWIFSCILAVILSPIFVEMFKEYISTSAFSGIVQYMPLTISIINNLPLEIFFLMMILVGVSYAKPPQSGGSMISGGLA